MTTARRLSLAIVVLAIPLFGTAAARSDTTFYEAYENGLASERAGRFAEARSSFLKAQALRPEAGTRVRAYGLNFIEAYDPSYHLALACTKLALLDEADRHLKAAVAAKVTPAPVLSRLSGELASARVRAAPTSTPAPDVRGVEPVSTEPTAARRAPSPTTTPVPEPPKPAPTAPAVPETAADRDRVVAAPREGVGEPTPAGKVPPVGKLPPSGHAPGTGASTGARPAATAPVPQPTPSPGPTPTGPLPEAVPKSLVLPWGAGGTVLLVVAAAALLARRRRRRTTEAPTTPAAPASESEENRTRQMAVAGSPTASSPDRAASASIPGVRPLGPKTDPNLGAYVLEGVLGRGAMGTTFLARRVRDGAPVALKLPHEHILEDPDFAQRFLREGSLGALLHHPNIVRIYEAGEHEGHPFIAMELVPGTTLERILKEAPRLDLARALHVAREIALALDYAHMKGVVHRDLKPDNVMVLPDGSVKVMDYGIARQLDTTGLTASNTYLGTPLYSAPEALTPAEVGPASDLYSLGIVLYRCLTGAPPFVASTPLEVFHKHAYEPLPPFPPELGIPPEVFGLVLELTAKQKADRYKTAEHFVRDLDTILNRL